MFEPGTVKLLVAIVLFSIPVVAAAEMLANRRIRGRVITRAEAQAIGALVGLAVGVGFLHFAG
jgi:hypothetical protein